MSATDTLQDLYNRCTQSLAAAADGNLLLTTDAYPEYTSMLQTLPDSQLVIEQDPNTGSPATVTYENEVLSVSGKFNATWSLPGVDAVVFTSSDLTFTASPKENSDDLLFEINIQNVIYGSSPVTVKYQKPKNTDPNYVEDDWDKAVDVPPYWFFVLSDDYQEDESAISAFASLIGLGDGANKILPQDSVFDIATLKQLYVDFDPTGQTMASLSITAGPTGSWKIFDGFTIDDLGVTLNSEFSPLGNGQLSTSMSGDVHGTFTLESYLFDILLRLDDSGQLTFILSSDNTQGKGRDVLQAFAGLIGGDTLKNDVNAAIDSLEIKQLALNYITVVFDIGAKKLCYATVNVYFTFLNIPLSIEIGVPDVYFSGTLQPSIIDPDTQQEADNDVYINDILYAIGIPNDGIPDLYIDELSFYLNVTNNIYSFSLVVKEDSWYIDITDDTYFALKEIDMVITVDLSKTNSFSGELGCTLEIAGVDLMLSAGCPSGTGWDFKGSSGPDQEIPIGDLIADFVKLFGIDADCVPEPISSLIIENLGVEFNTGTKAFTFTAEAKFLLTDDPDAEPVDIVVFLHLSKRNLNGTEVYEIEFTGKIQIGTLIFSISFDKDDNMTTLMGSYTHTEDQEKINLKNDIVAPISTDLASLVPDGLEIDLRDVVLLYCKPLTTTSLSPIAGQPAKSVFLIGFDLGIDLDITKNIPLVGESLSADETVGIQNLQVIIASGAIAKNVIIDLNAMLDKGGVNPLPAQGDLTGYVNLSAVLNLGTTPKPLSLPIGAPVPSSEIYPPMTNLDGTSVMPSGSCGYNDGVTWITLQQILGPVNFQRIGIGYKDNVLSFYLSAAITVSGLTLSMDGLSFGSRLDEFTPEISIRGIGIDYANGPVEIGGSLLYSSTLNGDEYDGMATIDVEPLMLSAVGSYIVSDDMDSMFIYAVLGVPLGGVPFFFVTGLAAGFGYNRNLIMPSIYEVNKFPLVSTAMDAAAGKTTNNLTQELALMDVYITPALGGYFGAAGVKFTSFKLLDSFVMMALVFGDRFEIDILGMSSLIVPPESEKTPLAQIQMNLEARIAPEDGFFGVEAVLTQGSYILSRNCHLTGGFAFYLWFSGEHSGDFVVTMGGYNPYYKVPSHYPQIPRLGFNWQVDKCLSLKGDAYFALTPCAFMAGGHLQATWHSGPIKAWFTAGADFIISWKPYYYNVEFYIDVGASYTFGLLGSQTITVNVGANVHIWGPEFSGKATVDIYIISFTISFGDSSVPRAIPISWTDFESTFIPGADKVCSVNVVSGLLCKNSDDINDLGVINPKDFVLNTDSIIPAKNIIFGADTAAVEQADFGISPMALSKDKFNTTHEVIIQRKDQADWINVEKDFKIARIKKDSPVAMWGTSITPNIKGSQFIADTVTGLEIRPAQQPETGATKEIKSTDLEYEDYDSFIPAATFWEQCIDYAINEDSLNDITEDNLSLSGRYQIMSVLGKSEDMDETLGLKGLLLIDEIYVVSAKE